MRPLRLTMTAFGPYRDSETIDFRLLEDRRLFVISGNTGAGKTTIFDAICYAIYGTASGEDRSDPRMLRSHFADEDTHSAVEFEFSVGGRSYLVIRQMPHRKGKNKSETGGKAELYETTGGSGVPAVDRFMVSDVNARLEAIIGLTKEQFNQIVMLPQGEFRKLLTSDTDNKEEILRRIFRTELYERLEQRFQQKNRELQDELKSARSTAAAYVKQAEEALPIREDSQLGRVFEQEAYHAGQVIEALELEQSFYLEASVQANERKNKLTAESQALEAKLREAAALNSRYEEYDRKRSQLEQLHAKREEYAVKEQRLALAEKAAHLEPYEEHAVRTSSDAAAKRKGLESRKAELVTAERDHAEAAERHRQEEQREEERRNSEKELHKLTELLPAVRSLAGQQQAIEKLLLEEQSCAAKLAASEAELLKLREEKQAEALRIKAIEEETAHFAEKLDRLRLVEQQGKQLKRLIDIENEIVSITKMESEFTQLFEQQKAEHDRLEAAWIGGQASLLAAHLHDGKPCPVCGSESHPAKSELNADVPSREALQQAKERLSTVERELLGARAQTAAAQTTRASGIAELTESGLQADQLQEQREHLQRLWRELKSETEKLQQLSSQLPILKREAEQREQLLEQQMSLKEKLQQEQQQRMLERAAQQSVLQKELDRIPEELRSPEQLESRAARQQAEVQRLAAAWKLAQEQLQQTASKLAEHKAYANQAEKQLQEAESNERIALERQLAELMKSGFADIQQYREAALPEAVREQQRKELDEYRSAAALLSKQLEELQLELAGKQRIELAQLEEELAGMKRQLENEMASAQAALRMSEEAKRLSSSIAKAYDTVKKLEASLEEMMDIFHMLKGDNALKISFERYILVEFLEQILQAANERLRGLSDGQFLLQRSERLETRGKQSGLGLDVYDAYTGQRRDVKTLSGGEKFNASLSLALGMTDVIQSHQGGVSIEMMFIDEGFGSLDEESLQKAIVALVDLQKAGRMIGVISHVQELKEAFPACLEVLKTKEGYSRTALVVK